ncbi:hypothetical protein [Paenibacillus agaridevorans]|uniref:hypothetical protein n=1 Tax=Paenibacillus agaridevorans TaxID=171404 RepID=UPI001BE42B00|nr:hypothetical protein [Paenibacillus agaridevorans]
MHAHVREEMFKLIAKNSAMYKRIFQAYKNPHDYLERGVHSTMMRLQAIRRNAVHLKI